MKEKSLGQVAFEAYWEGFTKRELFPSWESVPEQEHWERAAKAVLQEAWDRTLAKMPHLWGSIDE